VLPRLLIETLEPELMFVIVGVEAVVVVVEVVVVEVVPALVPPSPDDPPVTTKFQIVVLPD